MKKKVIIGIISVLVVISGCLFVMFNISNKSYYVITNETEEKIMNTNALTMMYETEAGSGEYQASSDTIWPQDGYVFNGSLSKCENGSTLSWNEENKRVLVEANTSDKCYVYFDKVSYTIGSQNTMEVYVDDSGRLIASAVSTTSAGSAIREMFHLIAVDDITNISISVKYNPDASRYRGRTTISAALNNAPLMVDTGVDKYVDGEPVIYTGSLNAGDEIIVSLQRNNYRLTDSNIDFIMTGDGL